jgi:hypothetical protein
LIAGSGPGWLGLDLRITDTITPARPSPIVQPKG